MNENMSESKFLICTRCGSRIRREQRNCLKCGQLNFENPDNYYMKKYEKKYNKGIDRNAVVKNLSIYNNKRPNEVVADNTGNIFVFGIINLFVFIVFGFIIMSNLSSGFNRDFILLLIGLEIFYLELYSFQSLLMKANKPWWYGLIVFCILFLFIFLIYTFKIKVFLVLLIILLFTIFYNIGHEFGKNPWICIILAPVMLPIIAFSNTVSYNGISYIIVGKKNNTFELLNKYNRIILFFNIGLIFIGFILLFFSIIL